MKGIYCIFNKDNGKLYVGSAANMQKRWNRHKIDLIKEIHHNKHLQRAYSSYGIDSFEFRILEEVSDINLLIEREQYYIDFYDACNIETGYNMNPTAGSSLGIKRSEETKEKLRLLRFGKTDSEETRKKKSDSTKGIDNHYGRPRPQGGDSVKAVSVIQYTKDGDFVKVFRSIKDVVVELNLKTHANVVSNCKGAINSAYGFQWRYHTEGYPTKIEPMNKRGEKFKELHGKGSAGHDDILKSRRATSIEKYGTSHPMQSSEVKLNHTNAVMEKYGVDNAAKHQDVRKKISETESNTKTAMLISKFPDLTLVDNVDGILHLYNSICDHKFTINRQLIVVRSNSDNIICTVCNPIK